MKTLSLKLDDKIFDEAEEITSQLKLARNRYINEAVSIYNLFNKRQLLKKKLAKESKLTAKDCMNLKSWLMKIKQFDIWLADLNPARGTEPGKTRPVVIIQTDLLNDTHLSTLVCPVTTNVQPEMELLRVHLRKNQLDKPSDILVDQIRAIDNKRLLQKIGRLTPGQIQSIKQNISIVLDL
jgi:mRNA interferase MazF